MIRSIAGEVASKGVNFLVLESGGIGFKVYAPGRALTAARIGERMKVFAHLEVKESGMELYGFLTEAELAFFELLISVSGVGPRSALSIMDVSDLKDLAAAIKEGRPDVLTRAAGVGRKTAERIIVELKNKVEAEQSEAAVKRMETDADLVETLTNLGYGRDEARQALGKVGEKITDLEARLKAALKMLSGRGGSVQ